MFDRSHPSWVRGLKYKSMISLKYTSLSHPSRVRGLKYYSHHVKDYKDKSHPSRVRGLKFRYLTYYLYNIDVALPVSAWIEIDWVDKITDMERGRTPRECVD